MKQVAAIVGPTASGKTALAIELCHQLLQHPQVNRVQLISADSRQVYRGLENLTGADLPEGFVQQTGQPYNYFRFGQIFMYGISVISPEAEWSLGCFRKLVTSVLAAADEHTISILVGGTGLYHRYSLWHDQALDVPPNPEVRNKAATLSVAELQAWVEQLQSGRLLRLNHSDLHNSRRLIRIIEQLLARVDQPTPPILNSLPNPTLGLEVPAEQLAKKITTRVAQRWHQAVEEVKQSHDLTLSPAAISTLGWREINQFLAGEVEKPTAQANWAARELAYAKRQQLWWRHEAHIRWETVNSDETYSRARDWLACAILEE